MIKALGFIIKIRNWKKFCPKQSIFIDNSAKESLVKFNYLGFI